MNLRSKITDGEIKPADEYAKQLRNAATMEQAGRFVEARELYLSAMTIKPGGAAGHDGVARMATMTGDPKAGIEYLRAAIATNPQRIILRERLAGMLLNAGELVAAEGQTLGVLGSGGGRVGKEGGAWWR